MIRTLKLALPATAVHVLSNGRTFENEEFAKSISAVEHPDLMFGIPIYSDVAHIHDFVVQAEGAFDETLRGILNLKRHGTKVEIRIVIHRQTMSRLPELAQFIARNLLFVDHVALMGLEVTGFARANLQALTVDPSEYVSLLARAVNTLSRAGIRTSIYNHPCAPFLKSFGRLR